MKVKYVLPAVQMALAVALLWLDRLWLFAAHRKCDSTGPSPAFGILMSINAPLELPRLIWDAHVPSYWSQAVYVASVSLLWYWVPGTPQPGGRREPYSSPCGVRLGSLQTSWPWFQDRCAVW